MNSRERRTDPSGTPTCTSKGDEKNSRNTDLRLLVGDVTVNCITTRRPKSTKLMKQKCMRDKVKCTGKLDAERCLRG
jgi:hypothetical protein